MPSSINFLIIFLCTVFKIETKVQTSKMNKLVCLQQIQRDISDLSKKLEKLREEEKNILQILQREKDKTSFGQTHLQISKHRGVMDKSGD